MLTTTMAMLTTIVRSVCAWHFDTQRNVRFLSQMGISLRRIPRVHAENKNNRIVSKRDNSFDIGKVLIS